MIKILLFLIIVSITFSVQTHNDIDSATVPVHINVYVVSNEQQLTIVNEHGIQQDSIVINHFVSPDFQGEDTSQTAFYIQRGSGEKNQINLSSGVLDVILDREDVALTGDQIGVLETELIIEKQRNIITNGTNRIENRVTSRIIKKNSNRLNPNEQYSGDTKMTVIWKKE